MGGAGGNVLLQDKHSKVIVLLLEDNQIRCRSSKSGDVLFLLANPCQETSP